MKQLRLTPNTADQSSRTGRTALRRAVGSSKTRDVLPFPPGGVFGIAAPVAERVESALSVARNIELALDDMQRRLDDLSSELDEPATFAFAAFAGGRDDDDRPAAA